jgi:hypothetical protein
MADLNGFRAGTAGFLTPDIPDASGNESGTGLPTKNDYRDLRDLGLPMVSGFPMRRGLINGFTAEDTFSLAAKLSDEHSQCAIGDHGLDEEWPTP